MSGTILGISAFYHDSAAAIIRDGEIIAAAQEERFSRRKHDASFPEQAINYCLEEAFVDPSELDAAVFYDNPLLTADRLIKNFLTVAPAGREQWIKTAGSFFTVKTAVKDYIQQALGKDVRVLFTDHHMAHAAAAFYPSPFADAAILTVDGVGEWATLTLGHGTANRIELLKEIRYPHSLGLLYSAMTFYCGFKVNDGEYKLMGLAPYGKPLFANKIREHLIDVKDDGSFRLNTEYFGFLDRNVITSEAFDRLFGGPPRTPEARITRREMDLASSVQVVLEEVMLKLARHAKTLTGAKNLALAGGVALNCVANARIQSERIFQNLWIQPAAGDAGNAIGAALLAHHQYFGETRKANETKVDRQKGSYLGPAYSSAEICAYLDRREYPYTKVTESAERARIIAAALAGGKIIGYMAGRMEFGPRALGARSILGDPRRVEMQSTMNLKIKYRESFRPFAPAVLAEKASDYFALQSESPYMLLVAPVREERRQSTQSKDAAEDMLSIINQTRSDIPAVTHVDYSARVQTVTSENKPDFYELIRAFYDLTGCAVVVNTSFNVRDEPIVCGPQDAYRCFMRTEIDLLVMEDCLLWKIDQPAFRDVADLQRARPGNREKEDLAARFFDCVVVPLADTIRAGGVQFFALKSDSQQQTYYGEPSRRLMDRTAFELPAAESRESFVNELVSLWSAEGHPELAAMRAGLLELTEGVETPENFDEEVSEFTYAMF
jgi:carbamoyltransferase